VQRNCRAADHRVEWAGKARAIERVHV
jgi:hypothetical protein